jgi:hypothetical protein
VASAKLYKGATSVPGLVVTESMLCSFARFLVKLYVSCSPRYLTESELIGLMEKVKYVSLFITLLNIMC